MPARIDIPPELLSEGKYLYEETLTPISEICRAMRISRCAFYARVDEHGWVRRRYSCNPDYARAEPISHPAVPSATPENGKPDAGAATATGRVTPEQYIALSVRVYDAVQRQMDAIESIQRTLRPTKEMQSERTVRILATLNKALREIAAISIIDEPAPSDADHIDPVPHNIDQFRRDLARRINGLVKAERAGASESAREPPATLD